MRMKLWQRRKKMAKTLYEVFTGEKPELQQTKEWTSEMSLEDLQNRLLVIDSLLDGGKQRRGLKPMLKRQRQEILDEIEQRNGQNTVTSDSSNLN